MAASISLSAPESLMPSAEARLTAGDPIKNARALLRNALPINNKEIRDIQRALESISEALRIPGSKSLGPVQKSVSRASSILKSSGDKIAKDFAPEKAAEGAAAIEGLKASLAEFQAVIDAQNKQEVPIIQQKCLGYVSVIEEAMVKGFPFAVPAEYSNLPQLLGRANLEMSVTYKTEAQDGRTGGIMKIVLDGYNAPVSAGIFMDLVEKKFYDGMDIQRADGFVVQYGDPEGPEDGYVVDGKVRRVPLEVRYAKDKEITYELNVEELGRSNDLPALPFNAFGTLAWARSEFDNNSASSQVFFLLKESELTPTGSNLLDGRYAVFGYIVEGQDLLTEMKVGDHIDYIKVVSGKELLKQPIN